MGYLDLGKVIGPQGEPGPSGKGVPVGGKAGEILLKSSSSDYDTTWGNAEASSVYFSKGETSISANNVQGAIEELFTSVDNGKYLIASAVTDMGVDTKKDATFQQMADNIRRIESGADTSDATATPGDILAGKTAYVKGGKVEGLITSLQARTIMPSTQEQSLSAGNYLAGAQVIRGDANLQPVNIRKGVTLFGIAGAMESSFQATLTVKADAGAVVTATHSSGASVEELSTTGSVTMELPIDGKWTVTARRGVAQYNSVVITVSSNYTATLTAEIHIKYFGQVSNLSVVKARPATAAVGDFAIFAGGEVYDASRRTAGTSTVNAYDTALTLRSATNLQSARRNAGGASNESYAFFAGGSVLNSNYIDASSNAVDAYSRTLSRTTCTELRNSMYTVFGVSSDKYAIFVGSSNSTVDAYDASMSRNSATALPTTDTSICGASNQNYAMFFVNGQVVAYDNYLSRTIAETPPATATSAARAGNYVLFFNANNMYAYDLFLTKTSAEPAGSSRVGPSATSLRGFALFVSAGDALSTKADAYDAYLARTNPGDIGGSGAWRRGASSVGNYAILAGGRNIANNINGLESNAYAYQYV